MRPSLRFDVLEEHDFACFYCGKSAPEAILQVDHVQPRADGGTDNPANLVAACRDCNLGKGTRPLPRVWRRAVQAGWCAFVWEWVGATGFASLDSLPDMARVKEMFLQLGIDETIEMIGWAHSRRYVTLTPMIACFWSVCREALASETGYPEVKVYRVEA